MELLQFRYFCDAAKSAGFSAAAKKRGGFKKNHTKSVKKILHRG